MINGHDVTLSPGAQQVVARWAVKTAIMFLYATSPPAGSEAEHRAAIREGTLPRNAGVWIAAFHPEPTAYNSWIRARSLEMRADDHPTDTQVAQAVTLTLDYYVQQVLLSPAAWSARSLEPVAPAALLDMVARIPGQMSLTWPPARSLSVSDLEQNADLFCAVGYNTPAFGRPNGAV